MMKDPSKIEVPGFEFLPSGGTSGGDYCTGCACDNEQEEPFYLTFGNSWNLGWHQGY